MALTPAGRAGNVLAERLGWNEPSHRFPVVLAVDAHDGHEDQEPGAVGSRGKTDELQLEAVCDLVEVGP